MTEAFKPLPYRTAEELVAAFGSGTKFLLVDGERRSVPTRMGYRGHFVEVYDDAGGRCIKPDGAHMCGDSRVYLILASAEQAPEAGDGWVEWKGGECPIPDDTLVDVKFANGRINSRSGCADRWEWRHESDTHSIIAYRILKPAAEPATSCAGQAPESAGWVEWDCHAGLPTPKGAVEVRFRDGLLDSSSHVGTWGPHHFPLYEVVAYRVKPDPAHPYGVTLGDADAVKRAAAMPRTEPTPAPPFMVDLPKRGDGLLTIWRQR